MNPKRARGGGCAGDASFAPRPRLLAAAQRALEAALADERLALATYRATISRYGPLRPFVNIARAEERHIKALIGLFERYGLRPPVDATSFDPSRLPGTWRAACALGVEAELQNIALYDDELLPAVAGYPDITHVMTRLRDASRENHLPAFQRCMARQHDGARV